MKSLPLWCLLNVVFMARAGSYCHISQDEVDPVFTNTIDVDLVSAESIHDFLDEFDFTITTSPQELLADEHANKNEQSLRGQLLFTLQKLAVTCMIKMHHAGEWLQEKWSPKWSKK